MFDRCQRAISEVVLEVLPEVADQLWEEVMLYETSDDLVVSTIKALQWPARRVVEMAHVDNAAALLLQALVVIQSAGDDLDVHILLSLSMLKLSKEFREA